MKDNWVEELPILPFSEIFLHALKDLDKFGNMPDQPVNISTFYQGLKDRITRTNCEIIDAKNRDDVAAAETRLKLFQNELDKMRDGIRGTVIEGLLRSIYAVAGYDNGRMVVIPSCAWAGTLDWEEEILSFDGKKYTRLRTINGSKLTPEQRKVVKAHLGGDTPETKRTGAAGRPNSSDIVIAEFERRKAAGTTEKTLTAEAELLEAWFARQYLDRERVKAKTIMNKIRDSFKKNKESKRNAQK